MKRLLAGTLTAAFALGLTACGQQEECSAKPVIYLYPEQKTTVSVSLDYAGTLTATYPAYEDGWCVTAEPDGTLHDENGNEYSYLFWEGENKTDYDFSTGFCVAGADTADFLREKLAEIGLTPREYNEFIVYWLPKMQDNPYNLISFQSEAYTDAAKLDIDPTPDSVLRVFMAWKPLGNPEAARLSGINSANVLTFCYTLSGFMAALAGIVSIGRSGICNGVNAIQPYDTDAIAACIIGGASFMGGKGTMVGTMLGALIIAVLRNGFSLLSVSSAVQNLVLGLVIIGAVLLDVTRERMAAKARRLAAK